MLGFIAKAKFPFTGFPEGDHIRILRSDGIQP